MNKKNLHIAVALFLVLSCSLPALVVAQVKQLWGMTSQGGQYGLGVIFNTDSTGDNEAVQYNFPQIPGESPTGSLVQAPDGNLYGMTNGGKYADGILFQYNTLTSVLTKKIDFTGNNGAGPSGSLIQASDGNLYGVTSAGGKNGDGVLFQYNPSTNVLTKKIDFDSSVVGPCGPLIQASDGNLYGLTYSGGIDSYGTLFQYNLSGNVLTKEIIFNWYNGAKPDGSLMQASDSNLYGMTTMGGNNGDGVLFRYNPITSAFTKEADFGGILGGAGPIGSLTQASDGNLYGTTPRGGLYNDGILFQFNPTSSLLTTIIQFGNDTSGAGPCFSFFQASDSNLYGLTGGGGKYSDGVLFQYNPSTSVVIKEIDFAGVSNGAGPDGTLIQASDGNLYGMTNAGGDMNFGTLFQYNPSNSVLTKEIDFGQTPNGANPNGSLIQASDGNLYGMTEYGGSYYYGAAYGYGYGVLFQYNASSNVLLKKIDFTGDSNGANPLGSLIQASDGNLYGMTPYGGVNNKGVLFQYNPLTSVLTKKIDFEGTSNGANPYSSLIEASDGNLYGVTPNGGADSLGVLFQYNPTSSVLTKKIDFVRYSTGANPKGSLMEASDGNLYGVNYPGGLYDYGVLFQYNPSTCILTDKFDIGHVYDFGYNSYGALVQASDGNLYGTTVYGGSSGYGVLFQYNPTTSVLTNKIDYGTCYGSLITASDGNLYGMDGYLFQYNPLSGVLTKKFDFTGTNGQAAFGNLIEISVNNITTTVNINNPAGSMLNCYPDPFSSETNIEFVSADATHGTLEVYNAAGMKVAIIYNGEIFAGRKYSFTYQPSALESAGVYILRFVTDHNIYISRLIKMN